MKDDDTRRRSGLTGWLTSKVEGLTGGAVLRRRRVETPATYSSPTPRVQETKPRVDAATAAELERLESEAKRLQRELEDAQLMLMGKEAEFKNELHDATERNSELLDRVVKLTHRDRELQAKILDAKFDGSTAKDELKKLDLELRDLRRGHQAKEREVSELTAQVQELRGAGAPGEGAPDKDALEGQQRQLQERLDQAKVLAAERDALSTRLDDTETEMRTLREQLAAARVQAQSRGRTPDVLPTFDAGGDEIPQVAVEPTLGLRRVASGQTGGPLLAVAAGKRPTVARMAEQRRQQRGEVAERLLEHAEQHGGFASLPEPFLEQLTSRSGKGDHDDAPSPRRKRSSRQRSRRGRSRRSGPNRKST